MTNASYKSIIINRQSTLKVVQELFNQEYPFLKITFFTKFANQQDAFRFKHIERLERAIGDFVKEGSAEDNLIILPSMSVSDLDRNFQSLFHLTVKVYRQSGSLWLPVNATDSWSLDAQNNEGEALSI